MQVLILSDGIPGHFNQSKGVAALLAETMEINESLAIVNPKIRLLRSPIKLIARYLTKNLSTLKAKIIISLFQPIDLQKIDLIIAAGGNTAALSAALSFIADIPNIQLGSPRGIHSDNFNAHLTIDRYYETPNNIVLDITPNLYSPKICQEASNHKANENSCLLLIGGKGIGYSYDNSEWEQLIANIITFSSQTNSKFTIVTSRRTDPLIESMLQEKLAKYSTEDSIWFHSGGTNANLAELFGNSVQIFVTEDSAMMISEAISSGKNVTTLYPKLIKAPIRYMNHMNKYKHLNLINSQSISQELEKRIDGDNIENINLMREKLRRNILARIQP